MPPHLIFGGGGIGTTAKSFTFTWDTPAKVSSLLDTLDQLDVKEIDSGQSYPPTNPWCANTLLGQAYAAERGFLIHDKVAAHERTKPHLDVESMRSNTRKSFELMGVSKVPLMYAHGRDRLTSIEDTAAAFDTCYREGLFDELGLCNFDLDEMTQYFAVCEDKGYVKPTVYQCMYNPLYRKDEKDLLPLLRKHNCRYYGYSPLAGGFLTGKVTFGTPDTLYRTRWRGDASHRMYVPLYDNNEAMHEAVRALKKACDEASPPISMQEACLRWMMHHSALQDGDGITMGAKTIEQLVSNVGDARKGPLDGGLEGVREVIDGLWGMVEGTVAS